MLSRYYANILPWFFLFLCGYSEVHYAITCVVVYLFIYLFILSPFFDTLLRDSHVCVLLLLLLLLFFTP